MEGNLASRLKIILGPMSEECRRYCMLSVILPISHTIVIILYFDVSVGWLLVFFSWILLLQF